MGAQTELTMSDQHSMAVVDRAGSPNKVRIGQLSGKLQSLQDELEHEKQARSDAVELKLKVLDDKLLRAQISEEEKLKPLNEQISRLHEELAAERLSREVMDERKTKEIKAVESSISLDLTAEKRVSLFACALFLLSLTLLPVLRVYSVGCRARTHKFEICGIIDHVCADRSGVPIVQNIPLS